MGAVAAKTALAKLEGGTAVAVLDKYAAPEEVIVLPGTCAACMMPADTRMFQVRKGCRAGVREIR